MAAYNAAKFIGTSIESVRSQTYENWELVILNDGSTDATKTIVLDFNDSRIKYFENPKNMGLTYTRNRMLDLSRGEYIAVLDSDDVAYPERFARQVEFLEENPDCAVTGSSIDHIDESGKPTGSRWDVFAPDEEMPTILFFHNHVAHSTVMMRRNAIPSPAYREGYAPAEDYDLWIRISRNWRIHNERISFVAYRIHQNNTSLSVPKVLQSAERAICRNNIQEVFGDKFSENEISLAYEIFFDKLSQTNSSQYLAIIRLLLIKFWRTAPQRQDLLNRRVFGRLLLQYYVKILGLTKMPRSQKIREFLRIPIADYPSKVRLLISKVFDKSYVRLRNRFR